MCVEEIYVRLFELPHNRIKLLLNLLGLFQIDFEVDHLCRAIAPHPAIVLIQRRSQRTVGIDNILAIRRIADVLADVLAACRISMNVFEAVLSLFENSPPVHFRATMSALAANGSERTSSNSAVFTSPPLSRSPCSRRQLSPP